MKKQFSKILFISFAVLILLPGVSYSQSFSTGYVVQNYSAYISLNEPVIQAVASTNSYESSGNDVDCLTGYAVKSWSGFVLNSNKDFRRAYTSCHKLLSTGLLEATEFRQNTFDYGPDGQKGSTSVPEGKLATGVKIKYVNTIDHGNVVVDMAFHFNTPEQIFNQVTTSSLTSYAMGYTDTTKSFSAKCPAGTVMTTLHTLYNYHENVKNEVDISGFVISCRALNYK